MSGMMRWQLHSRVTKMQWQRVRQHAVGWHSLEQRVDGRRSGWRKIS